MDSNNENTIEILNDLIRINNDRIEGYNRAAKETQEEDEDLRILFHRMAGESRIYLKELTQEVQRLGGEPAEGTTGSGKLYRAWMEVKATFTGNDRKSTLSACEFGEDTAQRAYELALAEDDLPLGLAEFLSSQKAALKTSHDEIKRYRDEDSTG